MRLSVIELEKIILKELGFELYRIMDHPHKLMHHYLKLLKANNEVARKAWNYLNDSYRTSLCVHYPSSTIAAACIYLSLRNLSIPMPNKPWWVLMETSIEQIHDICAEVLNLYSQPKICLKDIKDIIEDSCKCLKIEINYSFAYDELFQNEENRALKIEIDDNSLKNSVIPAKNSNIFGKNIYSKDVNSSSSTVKEINKKDKNSDRNSKRPSKTKSKSPANKKDERNKTKKRRKNRNNRSRSRSKTDKSESDEKSEESSRERSESRHRKRNNENRNRRKRREDEKDKRRRKHSRSNEKSGEKSRSKSKKNIK